jgi:putative ABC transport system ATP-binding protein
MHRRPGRRLESRRSARAAARPIGFIFQAPYLIPFLDVTDNVALLPMLAGKPNAEARNAPAS